MNRIWVDFFVVFFIQCFWNGHNDFWWSINHPNKIDCKVRQKGWHVTCTCFSNKQLDPTVAKWRTDKGEPQIPGLYKLVKLLPTVDNETYIENPYCQVPTIYLSMTVKIDQMRIQIYLGGFKHDLTQYDVIQMYTIKILNLNWLQYKLLFNANYWSEWTVIVSYKTHL